MKKVAHGIDEDHPRSLPCERLDKAIRSQGQVEAGFKWMSRNIPKALGKSGSVAVVASGADVIARVFNVASVHSMLLLSAMPNVPPPGLSTDTGLHLSTFQNLQSHRRSRKIGRPPRRQVREPSPASTARIIAPWGSLPTKVTANRPKEFPLRTSPRAEQACTIRRGYRRYSAAGRAHTENPPIGEQPCPYENEKRTFVKGQPSIRAALSLGKG